MSLPTKFIQTCQLVNHGLITFPLGCGASNLISQLIQTQIDSVENPPLTLIISDNRHLAEQILNLPYTFNNGQLTDWNQINLKAKVLSMSYLQVVTHLNELHLLCQKGKINSIVIESSRFQSTSDKFDEVVDLIRSVPIWWVIHACVVEPRFISKFKGETVVWMEPEYTIQSLPNGNTYCDKI